MTNMTNAARYDLEGPFRSSFLSLRWLVAFLCNRSWSTLAIFVPEGQEG